MADSENTTLIEETEEVWKEIPGYEGYYSVSNIGRVRRDKQSCGTQAGYILKNFPDKDGYMIVNLRMRGTIKGKRVHRLVAQAFIGECPAGLEVNHVDTLKRNNNACNLEYCTPQRNIEHAIEHGLHISTRPQDQDCRNRRRGELHDKAKLTNETVIEARLLRAAYGVSFVQMARQYGVTANAIRNAVNRKTWKHV